MQTAAQTASSAGALLHSSARQVNDSDEKRGKSMDGVELKV